MTEEIKNKVKEIIEKTIRPTLQTDGGNIHLVEITDTGIVRVKLQGACATCPFSQMTMTLGVEKTLKNAIPEIDRVELAN